MHANLVAIKAVSHALSDLKESVVFVGGSTVALYINNAAITAEVRPTDDVDVVIELATYGKLADLDQRLIRLGFKNDTTSNVICRYKLGKLTVDIMPTDPSILGFSNIWYPEGFKNAINKKIDDQAEVKIFSIPYFLASKWEAYKGRGRNDLRTSHDFEDMVYILENVDGIGEDLLHAPDSIKNYFRSELINLIETSKFEEGVSAHISNREYANEVFEEIKSNIKKAFLL